MARKKHKVEASTALVVQNIEQVEAPAADLIPATEQGPSAELDALIADGLVETSIEAEVVAMLEANDGDGDTTLAPTEEVSSEPAAVDPAPAQEVAKFGDALNAIDNDTADGFAKQLAGELDARSAFETDKDSGSNIQRTLKGVRQALFVTRDYSRAALACNVDPSFVNRMLHDGSRYNVYAIGKYADVVKALITGSIGNKINKACIGAMFAVIDGGKTFSMDLAKAAASDKLTVESGYKTLMKGHRHTVSASTAPTQASSTMQALHTLGIVEPHGSKRNPEYRLTASPAVQQLREIFAPAA